MKSAAAAPSLPSGALRNLWQAGLDASWEMDIFGGTRRNLEAATADLQAAVEDRRDVLVTLVGDVGSNYINLRGFQQQIDIARKNLKAQKHNADIIQKRHDAGFVGGLDVANAKAQVATTEATIPVFESSARAAIYSLGVLLGREPAALDERPGQGRSDSSHPAWKFPWACLQNCCGAARTSAGPRPRSTPPRPASGWPPPTCFPSLTWPGPLAFPPREAFRLGSCTSNFWSWGPSVTWPIFAGGRIYWNIKVQDALQEQALLTYEKTVLTALKDVETALVAYAKQQETRKSLSEAVVNNRKAVDLATQLYLAGKSDFLNVTTAQRNLFVTEDALAQSTRTVDTNLIALYKALGGGWEKNEPSPEGVKDKK